MNMNEKNKIFKEAPKNVTKAIAKSKIIKVIITAIVLTGLFFYSNTVSLSAEDNTFVIPAVSSVSIALEILNIPSIFEGGYGLAALQIPEGEALIIEHRIFGNIFSGVLRYKDGSFFTLDKIQREIRYLIILVIVDKDDETKSETRYSRQFLIESGVITLDFNNDFFDSAIEALQRYSPSKNILPREKLWALALTGFLTINNSDQHDLLGFNDVNENNRRIYLELLRRDWGVNNREELLNTIRNTENNGHAAALRNIKNIIQKRMDTGGDFSINSIYYEYNLNSRNYNYLKFVAANWNIYRNRTILGWDLGRIIALCRWGYSVGFLTEEEAWEKIMNYAKKIQPMYQSWDDFGYDYYMGRVFWASGFGDDINYLIQTDRLYRNLLGEQGYWTRFEWNINLEE